MDGVRARDRASEGVEEEDVEGVDRPLVEDETGLRAGEDGVDVGALDRADWVDG